MREFSCKLAIFTLLSIGITAACLADEILRDPTRPYLPQARELTTKPRYAVNAIIVSTERRVAIVNGQRVGVGDTIDGATVVTIEKHQLVLEQDGTRITVGLNRGAAR